MRAWRHLTAVMLATVFGSAALAQQTPQRPSAPVQTPSREAAVRGTYGAWRMLCEQLPGAQNEICALFQTVEAADRPNTALAVFAFRTADQRTNIMRVIAPLGVLLTGGLGLQIDDQNIGSTDFVRCWPTGCIAEARLSDELMNRLRSGQQARFIIFMTPEEGVGIPISLEGFAPGFDALIAQQQANPTQPTPPPTNNNGQQQQQPQR